MQHYAKGILYIVTNSSPYHVVMRWSDTTISSTIKTKDYAQEKKYFQNDKKSGEKWGRGGKREDEQPALHDVGGSF
jgi:hypothetical protein